MQSFRLQSEKLKSERLKYAFIITRIFDFWEINFILKKKQQRKSVLGSTTRKIWLKIHGAR